MQRLATWPLSDLLPPSCAMLTSPHSLQRYLLLVMELKVSPQLLHPGFSLSRLVLEDDFLDSIYKEATGHRQLWRMSRIQARCGMDSHGCGGLAKDPAGDHACPELKWTLQRGRGGCTPFLPQSIMLHA